jgi:hypothetical protein
MRSCSDSHTIYRITIYGITIYGITIYGITIYGITMYGSRPLECTLRIGITLVQDRGGGLSLAAESLASRRADRKLRRQDFYRNDPFQFGFPALDGLRNCEQQLLSHIRRVAVGRSLFLHQPEEKRFVNADEFRPGEVVSLVLQADDQAMTSFRRSHGTLQKEANQTRADKRLYCRESSVRAETHKENRQFRE